MMNLCARSLWVMSLVLMCLSVAASPVVAGADARSVDQLYTDAATLAFQNKPAEAAALLERVVAAQPNSGDAHFALGTIYAEQKNYAAAVLELRRAQLLKPDSDTAANLAWVREQVLQSAGVRQNQTSMVEAVGEHASQLPLEYAYAAAVLGAALCGAWLLLKGSNRGLSVAALVLAVLAVGLAAACAAKGIFDGGKKIAVVVRATEAKSGPDARYKTLLSLVPGDEVSVQQAGLEGFSLVRLPNGEAGHVLSADLKAVLP